MSNLLASSFNCNFSFYVLATGAEVGGEGGHWGGWNNGKKEKQKEKDLCQQMKEPSFSCVSGEIK